MSATGRSESRDGGAHPRDLFQTPAADLLPLLRAGVVRLDGMVWEPCAGKGAIVRALIDFGVDPRRILASDVANCADDMPDDVELVGCGEFDLAGTAGRLTRRDDVALTVITNPPYRVPYAESMCGMTGDLLERMIPKTKSTKAKAADGETLKGPDGEDVRLYWRDGVAMAFNAGDIAGADQVVLGPIRLPWWTGAAKTRRYLRRQILISWNVRMFTLGYRPRFLDADGVQAASSDACEYGYLVADRRATPRKHGEVFAVPFIELEG